MGFATKTEISRKCISRSYVEATFSVQNKSSTRFAWCSKIYGKDINAGSVLVAPNAGSELMAAVRSS